MGNDQTEFKKGRISFSWFVKAFKYVFTLFS